VGTTMKLPPDMSLTLNWWGNLDLTDARRLENEFTEYDWTATLGFGLGPVAVCLGAIEYVFPHDGLTDSDAREVFLQLCVPLPTPAVLPTTLTLSGNYDVHLIKGAYAKLGLQTGYALTDKWRLNAHVDLGAAENNYNNGYFGENINALNDLAAGVALNATIDSHTAATLGVEYSQIMDGAIRRAADSRYGDDAATWVVARFTVGF
jgi:hypothetical protein